MRLLVGHTDTVAQWALRYGPLARQPDAAFGIIDNDGVLRGALILYADNQWTAELEVVGTVTNDIAKAFFAVVFQSIGLERLEIKTSRTNKATKKAAPKWGFTFDGVRKRYYGPHGDALCWYMTPETCRWLKDENAESAEAH